MRVLSLNRVHIYCKQFQDKICRPHREITHQPQEVNFSSCEYFNNTDYVYIHGYFPAECDISSWFQVSTFTISSWFEECFLAHAVIMGNWKLYTSSGDDWPSASTNVVPQNQKASLQTKSLFCGYVDHRRGRETNFLADSRFNIHQKSLHLKSHAH